MYYYHITMMLPLRALNTFLDGLAELGVNKSVIKNKKVLSDLIEKEKRYRSGENKFENKSNVERPGLRILLTVHDKLLV